MNSQNEFAITGAIFDCDGTLLDSLNAWRGLEDELSRAVQVQVTPEEHARFATFTILEVARYFHEQYGLLSSSDAVVSYIDDYMMDYYAHQAQAIPGAVPFLEACAKANVRMCVVSSSAQKYLQAGLKNAGITEYFSHIFSVEDLNATKREPLIFEHAQAALGTQRSTTWGVDDSLYALETLTAAGFPAIGIGGQDANATVAEAQAVCPVVVTRLDELSVQDGKLVRL